jgi:hypothetical protein
VSLCDKSFFVTLREKPHPWISLRLRRKDLTARSKHRWDDIQMMFCLNFLDCPAWQLMTPMPLARTWNHEQSSLNCIIQNS